MVEGISLDIIGPVVICGAIFYLIMPVAGIRFQRFDLYCNILPEVFPCNLSKTIFVILIYKKIVIFVDANFQMSVFKTDEFS